MLNPKSNVCKLKNGVLLGVFACFQDGRQNHTESYIVVNSLFNVPRHIWGVWGGVVCWSLFYYAPFCVLSILLTEENDCCFALIVFLMSCDCKCSVAIPHDAVGLSAVLSVFFPVYTHLLFAYLMSCYYNDCFIHSTILNYFQAFEMSFENRQVALI